mmetsp:Transcript_26766/g.69994  ORF Transcript_26766/g.69994 Transcript_26766/m.69994 type:complete len:200 (+) Transcript_26766:316-915(+)
MCSKSTRIGYVHSASGIRSSAATRRFGVLKKRLSKGQHACKRRSPEPNGRVSWIPSSTAVPKREAPCTPWRARVGRWSPPFDLAGGPRRRTRARGAAATRRHRGRGRGGGRAGRCCGRSPRPRRSRRSTPSRSSAGLRARRPARDDPGRSADGGRPPRSRPRSQPRCPKTPARSAGPWCSSRPRRPSSFACLLPTCRNQ